MHHGACEHSLAVDGSSGCTSAPRHALLPVTLGHTVPLKLPLYAELGCCTSSPLSVGHAAGTAGRGTRSTPLQVRPPIQHCCSLSAGAALHCQRVSNTIHASNTQCVLCRSCPLDQQHGRLDLGPRAAYAICVCDLICQLLAYSVPLRLLHAGPGCALLSCGKHEHLHRQRPVEGDLVPKS